MTNPDLMLIAALLDRSGSMQSIADDTRGGFDAFITKELEQPGTTLCTLAQSTTSMSRCTRARPSTGCRR